MGAIMKKVYVGILICLVIVSAGCGKKYMQETDDTDWEQGTVQNITDAQSCYVNNKVADDGYGYYFTDGTKGKYYRIYYYDAGCEQAVPLCSKVNCSHKGEDCDAYYTADQCYNGYIWYQNGHLFRLEYDTKTGDMKLIYFDKDGSNEKSAGVLWNGENVVMNKVSDYEKNMILHKGYIYYCYETDMQEETTVYRLKIDGSGEKEQIGIVEKPEIEVKNQTIAVRNNQNRVYITVDYSVKDTAQHYMELYEYRLENGGFSRKMTEQAELDYAYQYDESGEHIIGVTGEGYRAVDLRNIAFDDDGNMYVYQSITGKVLKCNIDTGENVQIYQDDGYGIIECAGDCLYLNQKDTGSFDKQYKITVIDLSGNYIKQIDCQTAANSYPSGKNDIFMKKRVSSEQRVNSEGKNIMVEYLLYDMTTGESKVILEGTA